jgi:hypothetical protein
VVAFSVRTRTSESTRRIPTGRRSKCSRFETKLEDEHLYARGRVRLAGIPINKADCRTLVDLLLRVGREDDLAAAAAIERGLATDATIIALSTSDRRAILGVLDDPPDGGLVELRGELARDFRNS